MSGAEQSVEAILSSLRKAQRGRRHESLVDYGYAVLTSADMIHKVSLSLEAYEEWKTDALPILTHTCPPTVPSPPERPERPNLTSVSPAARRSGLNQLIHALCHIESVAIDLSWDMLVRFALCDPNSEEKVMPRAFFDDWVRIAAEEARHFVMWEDHLKSKGFAYGSFPIHEALWESALDTSQDIVDRLCICHMVHEAHGLDVNWRHEKKMSGDPEARRLLGIIHGEEITHVAAGLTWYRYVLTGRGLLAETGQHRAEYERILKLHFRGELKPPFNVPARDLAGFPREWYSTTEDSADFRSSS